MGPAGAVTVRPPRPLPQSRPPRPRPQRPRHRPRPRHRGDRRRASELQGVSEAPASIRRRIRRRFPRPGRIRRRTRTTRRWTSRHCWSHGYCVRRSASCCSSASRHRPGRGRRNSGRPPCSRSN
ncbi:MAG: hypothetical protein DLM61_24865 [Pseudonocardiales bacterium]|nr:MAG: hypothetical protein DLM61_24865 [Pseudonocardiales bacterium]